MDTHHGDDAGDPPDRAVEAELTDERKVADDVERDHVEGDEQPDGDRQIETRAGLAVRRRGEVDRDLLVRPSVAGRDDRRTHAIAGLAAGLVGKTEHREPGDALGDVDLDADRMATRSEDRRRANRCNHLASRRPAPRSCAGSCSGGSGPAPRQLGGTIPRGCRNATAAVAANATLVGVLRLYPGSAAILVAIVGPVVLPAW